MIEMYEKERFMRLLYDMAEKLIVKRRNKINQSHRTDLKDSTSRHLTHHEKITYLENSIERDIEFFQASNKINDCDDMVRLKNQIKKVE